MKHDPHVEDGIKGKIYIIKRRVEEKYFDVITQIRKC